MALDSRETVELTSAEIQKYSAEAHINLREKITEHVVARVNAALMEANPQPRTPKEIGDLVRQKLQELFPPFNFSLKDRESNFKIFLNK